MVMFISAVTNRSEYKRSVCFLVLDLVLEFCKIILLQNKVRSSVQKVKFASCLLITMSKKISCTSSLPLQCFKPSNYSEKQKFPSNKY